MSYPLNPGTLVQLRNGEYAIVVDGGSYHDTIVRLGQPEHVPTGEVFKVIHEVDVVEDDREEEQ